VAELGFDEEPETENNNFEEEKKTERLSLGAIKNNRVKRKSSIARQKTVKLEAFVKKIQFIFSLMTTKIPQLKPSKPR
jgi:hypothetical protein